MAKDNYRRYQDRIIGKIILQANLENETPILIGTGEGDVSDSEAMKWPIGDVPYIPASSMAGRLKRYFKEFKLPDPGRRFWGRSGEDDPQSHLRLDDLIPESGDTGSIVLRDGVRIDPETNTAEESKKYDYQIVEPGLVFPFRAEITIRNGMNAGDAKEFAAHIHAILHHGFRIGAHTNTGFGKMKCSNFKGWQFEFPENADAWFNYLADNPFEAEELSFSDKIELPTSKEFSVEATFQLKTSLIIGAYGVEGGEPDKSQLKSRDKFVLPGKSIRGALRHRAIKILNTVGGTEAQENIEELFGHVDEKLHVQKRGRLRVEESYLEQVEPMNQDRIRIDRFTGGVIGGALFNSQPVWTTGEEAVRISFSATDTSPDEKKLLLLLLKDLWLEDLPIGGEKSIGRGVLRGMEATIKNDGDIVASFRRAEPDTLHFLQGSAADINQLLQAEPETNE